MNLGKFTDQDILWNEHMGSVCVPHAQAGD